MNKSGIIGKNRNFLTQGVSKRKDLMKMSKVIFHIKPTSSHWWWECKNYWLKSRDYDNYRPKHLETFNAELYIKIATFFHIVNRSRCLNVLPGNRFMFDSQLIRNTYMITYLWLSSSLILFIATGHSFHARNKFNMHEFYRLLCCQYRPYKPSLLSHALLTASRKLIYTSMWRVHSFFEKNISLVYDDLMLLVT